MYVFIPSVTVKKSAGACQRIQRGRDLLGDYFWCSSFLVLGIKINLYGNVDVTSFFLCLDQLAFWQGMGTIDTLFCCVPPVHEGIGKGCCSKGQSLCNMLHFLVFLIQAGDRECDSGRI